MGQIKDTREAPLRALVVGIKDDAITDAEARSLAKELAGLASTLGVEIAATEMVHVRENHSRYGVGTGKAEELATLAGELEVDAILFDREITPSQQRNWETLAGVSAMDRQEVIIQIFAARAKTREASLQVELARLRYALPRLAHKYVDLSRQRGGRYGTKGSGETKLEMDRRTVQKRIHQLGAELEEVRKHRSTQRKRRERIPIPSCALVGYTNAGKSSILNAMTSAATLVEDKLFATLDPTTRRIEVGKGRPVLLTDTVGFIRKLPHDLVDAFRATLEETLLADLLVLVLDASDPDLDRHYDTTLSVLVELGADAKRKLVVLNKIDAVQDVAALEDAQRRYADAVPVSAATGSGLDRLAEKLDRLLSGEERTYRFPSNRHDLVALLHRSGTVISERYDEDAIIVEARVGERLIGTLAAFEG